MKILFIYPNIMLDSLVPVHLPLLSACLKEKGFEVDLFDTTFYKTEEMSFDQRRVELLQLKPFNLAEKGIFLKESDICDDLAEKVADFKPDLIAITLVEDTWKLAQSLLEKIKSFNIPVIAGGVFVTFSPEEVINHSAVNMICMGEGEEALVELCQKMSEGEDYSTVKNLWIKKDGKIIKNSLRPLVDVNKLPFLDYDIFGRQRLVRPMFGKVLALIHVEMGRGCPYQCTYCESSQLMRLFQEEGCGIYYRRKGTDRLIAELKYLVKKYNPDYINFNSETFLAKPVEELRELALRYQEEIKVPFWCQTRPETVTEEKIKILKQMGCNSMNFGIEHGNEEFRKRVLKRYGSNRQIVEALKIVDQYEIPYTINNIVGFPDETRDLIFDTIELNRQINSRTINCYIFAPYKGTDLYKYCIERGYFKEGDGVHHVLDGGRLRMNTVSYEELKGLQRTFLLYVRFPKSEWPEIKIAEKFDEEGNRIFEKYKKIYQEKYFK
ncbi:MAG: B12-binding domain-containing radical SAM protein [Candidatus Nealsonbacteria bacterium]|nr:B12-binding domain-containing radical SAM protein [Candidatus Nealsonbacteria bacterium]